MANSIPISLSTAVLVWARTSMGYTIEEAARKAGVSIEQYEAWEAGLRSPTYKQLENLAYKVFKRPLAFLLLKEPPKDDPIKKDFRNLSNSEIESLSTELRFALRRAKRFQNILQDISDERGIGRFKEFKVSIKDKPEIVAHRFRKFINLTIDIQKSWNHNEAFNNFKSIIESIGIYVFQFKIPMEEARAFCLSGNHPVIVLNTDDSTNGRIFSLFHETCHIFFNFNGIFRDITTGELNNSYREIEDFCNQFAAEVLVPELDFREELNYRYYAKSHFDDYDIEDLANTFNVSKEVIARKLLQRSIISTDFFWSRKRYWDAQARSFKEAERERRKKIESKGIAQDIKVTSEKGKPYIIQVIRAFDQGNITSADVSNFLEVKLNHLPKIIQRINS